MKKLFILLFLGVSTLTYGSAPNVNFAASNTTISAGGSTTFTDNTTTNSSNPSVYTWTFTGGTPSSKTGIGPHTIQYAQQGSFDVTLHVLNPATTGSSAASDSETKSSYITVSQSTSIDDVSSNSEIEIYPNPSSNGILNIGLSGISSKKNTSLILLNLNGQIIYEEKRLSDGIKVIDVSEFMSGSYIIALRNKEKVITKSVIIN